MEWQLGRRYIAYVSTSPNAGPTPYGWKDIPAIALAWEVDKVRSWGAQHKSMPT